MELETHVLAFVILVFSCSCLAHISSKTTIRIGESITGDKKLVSSGGNFALGFFSPGNSTSTYLGIWYNSIPEKTVIWVANRASPIPHNSTANFTLGDDGNLVLFDGKGKLHWSSNVSSEELELASNSTLGALVDTGNLVLRVGESNIVIWESFEHPTDTFMPGMKLGYNRKKAHQTLITSWTSSEDPRPGNFIFGIEPKRNMQFYIWKHNITYYRFGDGNDFSGGNELGEVAWFSSVLTGDDGVYFTYGVTKGLLTAMLVLKPAGQFQALLWHRNGSKWTVGMQAPEALCERYAQCGPFGSCMTTSSKGICRCLPGFEPKYLTGWENRNWNGGCVRRVELGCDVRDEFLKLEKMKLPDNTISLVNMSSERCKTHCISNCSCSAYAFSKNNICLIWFGDLMDLADNITSGRTLYVRVHGSELVTQGVSAGRSAKRYKVLVAEIVPAVSVIALLISVSSYYFIKRKQKHLRSASLPDWKIDISDHFSSVSTGSFLGKGDMKLVQYSLQKIREATNNFHEDNKLGQGGFGPVFKGFLAEFGDIAIKRLSRRSSQGLEEFMNELKLIANLQHKNLVSLLGCCVEGEEKILIYEYMPNRSLDNFLFDPSLKITLDWSTRMGIIEGTAQGMLYLHKYSRLKVIHRDLKVSNILLDQEMIPKISDFGMARIFGTDQTQASTKRVVGTYGYISPEYIVYGQFSEKSDVFSFGVLLLEILTGQQNSEFFMTEISVSLLGWVYDKWKDGRILELIDPCMRETCDNNKATRSILVALLCVQEIPADRPTMSDVVVMLSNETIAIPEPKEPAFRSSLQSRQLNGISINEMTISLQLPR